MSQSLATTVCQNCGSRRFRADRALAGRLICQNCGLAAGSRPNRSTRAGKASINRSSRSWTRVLLVGLALLVFVCVVIMS